MADHFSEQADLYARYRPSYPEALYETVLGHVPRRRAAWDCGTGPGQVARWLAGEFGQVFATDISREQLSHAPAIPNITYRRVPAEASGLPANTMDLVTVAQAIHWFDFGSFYREVRRTAAEGAVLAVIGYGRVRVSPSLNPIIDRLYESAFRDHFRQPRRYLNEHYATIPFPFEELDAPSFSMSYRWDLQQMEGYFNSWSAVQKLKQEEGRNPADEAIRKLSDRWQPGEEKEVTFPVFVRLGRITSS